MGLLDTLFRRNADSSSMANISAMAQPAQAETVFTTDDIVKLLQSSSMTNAGISVTVEAAMKNTSIFRCVSLITNSMGMLPMHLIDSGTKEKAREHPLFRLLHREPNNWQTAFEFRSFMQYQALTEGDAFALIVRSRNQIIRLVPLKSSRVSVKQLPDWSLEYSVTLPQGGVRKFPASDIFHLRGMSDDGIRGISLVKAAAESIAIAIQAEKAAARLFKNGMLVGGKIKHPKKLSDDAKNYIRNSIEEANSGASNANRWMFLEEDMDAEPFSVTAKDSQHMETRKFQAEENSRVFGVPRPLLMLDETNWGTGVGVLGQFFVRYGLQPWFTAWEQCVQRSLLIEDEKELFEVKFNAGALMRGSMEDQGEFFAKALGSGGHQPWMTANEVRGLQDLPDNPNGDKLAGPANVKQETSDVPS